MSIHRRAFLKAAGVLGTAATLSAADKFDKPLGVQLYTVRRVMPKDSDATLRRIAEIGYTEVEGLGLDMQRIRPLLDKYHLKCASVHFDTGLITGHPDRHLPAGYTWDRAIADAKDWGLEYMVIPYLPEPERGDFGRFVDQLNHAGEQCNNAGLKLCYHQHAFEFGGQPGHRPIDIFWERSDPKLVNLEMDVFWVSVSGNDPVELLRQHGDRVRLLHLKDKAKGTPVMAGENVPRTDFKEVGNGVLDFPSILREAEKAGVRHYYVEQDEAAGDPVDSLRQSYQYLRSLTL